MAAKQGLHTAAHPVIAQTKVHAQAHAQPAPLAHSTFQQQVIFSSSSVSSQREQCPI